MRSLIFILSIMIFFSVEIISCKIKKEVLNSNEEDYEKIESVKLDFEILTDEISLEEINRIDDFRAKVISYSNFEILATLKQINKTEDSIEVDNFIIYENFDIVNIDKINRADLISFYDYSIVLDPETFEIYGITDKKLKPNGHLIDSINLVKDFRFYLSKPDTFLIRIKKQYFGKEICSNWDTLVVR